jgi:hypothetical protein
MDDWPSLVRCMLIFQFDNVAIELLPKSQEEP